MAAVSDGTTMAFMTSDRSSANEGQDVSGPRGDHHAGIAEEKTRGAPGAGRLGVTAVMVVALVVTGASSALGTPPGDNGRISFMRTDDAGHWQIWTSNPDLSTQHKVTDGEYDNGWATWSPDGTQAGVRLGPAGTRGQRGS